jgi:hypothetical protein
MYGLQRPDHTTRGAKDLQPNAKSSMLRMEAPYQAIIHCLGREKPQQGRRTFACIRNPSPSCGRHCEYSQAKTE